MVLEWYWQKIHVTQQAHVEGVTARAGLPAEFIGKGGRVVFHRRHYA